MVYTAAISYSVTVFGTQSMKVELFDYPGSHVQLINMRL